MQTAYRYRFRSLKGKTPQSQTYALKAKVWVWKGPAAWHFVTLPRTAARQIRAAHGFNAKGWGSLPVSVEVGSIVWKTSIFPDQKTASYLLPLKADVRAQAGIRRGDRLSFQLTVY